MGAWYKNRFRRTLLDMHIEDWDEEFLSEYNPEKYFEALKVANIDAPMIYVQSHVGLCYWPTKVGAMHQSFIGKEDQVKRLFDMCHQDGMDVVLYYSLVYNNREYERHPEWRMKDPNGLPSRAYGSRYGLCCPNNKDYVKFVHTQIEEFSEYFDYEGIFFDMGFWPEVCYCDSCRARWANEVGGEMPTIVDWKDDRWVTLTKKLQEWMGEFTLNVTKKAKQEKEGITVEHQYSGSMYFWRFGINENISIASDYIGTDLYGGLKQQSFACKAWYNLTQNQPFQYMTSRCEPSLNEHTTMKSKDQLMQCVAMTYLHHGASFLIDAIDPSGSIDSNVYELMGEIFRKTEEYEPYLSRGDMSYNVGIYYNLNGKMDVESNQIHVLDHRTDRQHAGGGTMPHQEGIFGVCESLTKHHIPYGVVNNWKLEQINNAQVLVLSDVPMMEEREITYIKNYIKAGGNVYMSGHSAPELLEEICGLKWEGYTQDGMTYMSPTQEDRFINTYFTEKYPLVMCEKAVVTSGEVKGNVLATITLPYTLPCLYDGVCPTEVPDDQHIDETMEGYKFSTIHANPPGKHTTLPAMVESAYGKGKVIWSALPIERADRYQHSDIFSNIIEYLMDDKRVFGASASTSETIECVMFDAPEQNQILFGAVETRKNYRIPDTRDSEFWIKVKEEPKAVVELPNEESIPFSYQDGIVTFEVDRIKIWKMFAIKYE